ncbi:MAG: hypothetical protein A3F80_01770 [Candidatus Melainabacteria bacterium RIFCSPLOWO2_12_FULL_35_11]|nr:MAG: hypothetical protein A3F80_01770 [Candidatus Melainabacteria bacterium RIFCSPLOWO2_12_FULL_35_11]
MKESHKALILSTISFAVAFAVWGMISPLAKTFQANFLLTEKQTWSIIAIPVLLGSILRIPIGMLADKYGGRVIFGILLLFISLPAYMLSFADSYSDFALWGLLLGMAGTSFSVGIAFASKWFPPKDQGLALGIFGMGNIGQSVALFMIPTLAAILTWQRSYQLFALVALVWGVIFLLFARDAEVKAKPKSFGEMFKILYEQPLSWLLGLFYFVTFGGFVALSIGLPKLLQEIFHLTAQDAGFRVAGFVALATLVRPLGGFLGDKVGGAKVLMYVFLFTGLLALGMSFEHIVPFTIGALGVAACVGLGNGAVFKLVPEYFPKDTGTVTGLVGAMGGLGGFFPPLVLGYIKTYTGQYDLGFLLLSIFCLMCMFLNFIVFFKVLKQKTA